MEMVSCMVISILVKNTAEVKHKSYAMLILWLWAPALSVSIKINLIFSFFPARGRQAYQEKR